VTKYVACDIIGSTTALSVTESPAVMDADCKFVLLPCEIKTSPVMNGVGFTEHPYASDGSVTVVADEYEFALKVTEVSYFVGVGLGELT
jgi:hypothetical protein